MARRMAFNFIGVALAGFWLVAWAGTGHAAEKKKAPQDGRAVMSEAEIQSQVMAFADRFLSIVVAAYSAYRVIVSRARVVGR